MEAALELDPGRHPRHRDVYPANDGRTAHRVTVQRDLRAKHRVNLALGGVGSIAVHTHGEPFYQGRLFTQPRFKPLSLACFMVLLLYTTSQ